ncbi:MAG: hypothetical protein EOO74_10590 [Myxococcales bacterium]|nr:MAG: hypothetical protein EOO74_10590 [Myxococcales bacterium]
MARRLLHRIGSPDPQAELQAHVDAGWLEQHTRREGTTVVTRYRVLRAGWLAIDGLLEASCA